MSGGVQERPLHRVPRPWNLQLLRKRLQLLACHDRAERDVQEAHAVHAEGRGAAHARQPVPGVPAEDMTEPAAAASRMVLLPPPPLLLTATSSRNVARVPHCPCENHKVPDRNLPD